MHTDFPFSIDRLGQTATTVDEAYVTDLIEQLLLTAPGERVHRPDFGCGLKDQVFAPNQLDQAAALEYAIEAALTRFLGSEMQIISLKVEAQEEVLRVHLVYQPRLSQKSYEITVPREVP